MFRYPEFHYLFELLVHHTWQLWWYDHLVQSGCPLPVLEVLAGQVLTLRISPTVAGFAIF